MKNQYFADNRDLFKYDLVYEVLSANLVRQFSHIPMLTQNDGRNDGHRTDRRQAKVGTKNPELVAYLDMCLMANQRNITEIEPFFNRYEMSLKIYGKGMYFSDCNRNEYFAKIGPEYLKDSLIVLDPDNGLETGHPSEKHIKYLEIKGLYDRMDGKSILTVFQFFPREEHFAYLWRRSEEIRDRVTGELPVCIDDNEVIFFFLTKDSLLEQSLIRVIEEYIKRYTYSDGGFPQC